MRGRSAAARAAGSDLCMREAARAVRSRSRLQPARQRPAPRPRTHRAHAPVLKLLLHFDVALDALLGGAQALALAPAHGRQQLVASAVLLQGAALRATRGRAAG